MKEPKFSEYEEEIIQAGVDRYFKEARAEKIKAEIAKRISTSEQRSCQITKDDLMLFGA